MTFNTRVPAAQPKIIGRLRHELVAFAAQVGACQSTRDAVALAVSEAVTNVVVHAYIDREPGEVIVEAWRDDGRMVVRVCDDGRGMVPRNDSPGMGLGLTLIAKMADNVQVADRAHSPGTMVAMCFSLDGSGTPAAGRSAA